MAEHTGIEWCDHTMNFWLGCTKVSPACDFCYAEHLMDHRMHRVEWGGERVRTSEANWRLPYRWNEAARKAGVRRRVFTLSLGDFFDNQVPEEWRHAAWETIAECQHLDWLVLTKRPQNIAKMLPADCAVQLADHDWPWPHVWLGTTAENQEEANRRIPALLAVPAAKHFISAEPLLGPIGFRPYTLRERPCPGCEFEDGLGYKRGWASHSINCAWRPDGVGIDWVIAGGESGSAARPWSIHWARELRDQCTAAGVPFFWKQNGEWIPAGSGPSGEDGVYAFGDYDYDRAMRVSGVDGRPRKFTTFGARSVMKRVGKKAAGRLLDGRAHDEMPA